MSLVLDGTLGVDNLQAASVAYDDVQAGMVIQVANYTTGVYVSGTTTIPFDNTIPQITEGNQVLSLAFTPKKANSLLKVEVSINAGTSVTTHLSSCLFRDSVANAIGVTSTYMSSSGIASQNIISFVSTNSTSQTTFTVRVGGGNAGTYSINGYVGQYYGGAMTSSITITEIAQ